jgi:trans-aconitate 2-methyltransferase
MALVHATKPLSHEIDADVVRSFYDEFSLARMLDYRLEKNLRIEFAIQRIERYVEENSNVLDLGCGIGIVSERIAEIARAGTVWACDLSEQNIWYAKRTVNLPNLYFRSIDLLREFDKINEWVNRPPDLVTLIDVLEHLPINEHEGLFRNLSRLMAKESRMVLTFPSAQYQRYLQKNEPEELQIIDEILELSHIAELASSCGFVVEHFSLENIWMTNQYAHCVLRKSDNHVSPSVTKLNAIDIVIRRVHQAITHHVLRPIRKKKYVTNIFGS